MIDYKLEFENFLIEQGLQDVEILEIFETGSQLFRPDPQDIDVVAICKDYPYDYIRTHKIIDGVHYDFLILDKEATIRKLTFTSTEDTSTRAKLYNYMHLYKNVIYGNADIQWNMFDYEAQYKEYLKITYINSIGKMISKYKFSKGFVHYYIVMKFYENKKVEITEQMAIDIARLYAGGQECMNLIMQIDADVRAI